MREPAYICKKSIHQRAQSGAKALRSEHAGYLRAARGSLSDNLKRTILLAVLGRDKYGQAQKLENRWDQKLDY